MRRPGDPSGGRPVRPRLLLHRRRRAVRRGLRRRRPTGLLAAAAAHGGRCPPAPPPIPATVDAEAFAHLVEVGIVELVGKSRYRLHGMNRERTRRSQQGMAGAMARWGSQSATAMPPGNAAHGAIQTDSQTDIRGRARARGERPNGPADDSAKSSVGLVVATHELPVLRRPTAGLPPLRRPPQGCRGRTAASRRRHGAGRHRGAGLGRPRPALGLPAHEGTEFDAVRLVDAVGFPEHQNLVGATVNAMAKAGLIRAVGFHKSERERSNARQIQVWRRQ